MAQSPNADVNLLFGILAVQMDFITRDQLVAAMHAWVLDKSKSLGAILVAQKVLAPERHTLLEALVREHLKQHQNDPQKSLAAVSSVGSVRKDLDRIADADVQASMMHVAGDPYATVAPPSVGTPTSSGLRFRILRPHAKGGLGEVFVAHDEELHREVALKEIQDRHADHPESRSRFLMEAEITGGLEHPGIVPVYGLGTYADGRPYYAMRFIRGDSLKDAIEDFHKAEAAGRDPGTHSLELRKLLGRFIDVCQAIQYAHDRGVLHRDLKPGNIMLGKYGETLVVDWGLAKATTNTKPDGSARETTETPLRPASTSGSAETIAGSAIGTPQYMSPEQAAGRLDLLGPASDVYSLGATFYCLLTGKAPVEDKDVATVLNKVQKGDFLRPRQIKQNVDPALEAFCLKAIALKGGDRYASPLLLSNDIEQWLAETNLTLLAAKNKADEERRKAERSEKAAQKALKSGTIATIVTVVVGAIIGIFVTDHTSRQAETDAAYFILLSRALKVQDRIDNFHEKHKNEASRVANWPSFQAFARTKRADRAIAKHNGKSFYEIMERSVKVVKESYDATYPGQLLAVGILDSSGTVLRSYGLKADQIHFKGFVHRYLQNAVDGKKATISDLYYAAETDDQAAIAYASPIQSDTEGVVGLVVIWVKADPVWKILEESRMVLDDMDRQQKVFLSLYDKTGISIGESEKKRGFHPAGEPEGKIDQEVLELMIKERRFGPDTDQLKELKPFPEAHKHARAIVAAKDVIEGHSELFNEKLRVVGFARRLRTEEAPWTLFCMVPKNEIRPLGGGSGSWADKRFVFFVFLVACMALLGPLAGLLISRWMARR